MKFSQNEINAILGSKEGQELIKYLQADGGKMLSLASAALKSGDTAKVVSLMQPIMGTEKAVQLVKEINQKHG